MATLERFEPAYVPWTPSASTIGITDDEGYIGRHRKPGARWFSFTRLFHVARHRRR